MVAAAVDGFGGLDIVVNNAGMPQFNGPMLDTDEATFDRIFAVNVKSLYLSAVHTVPVLRARGGGVILNTASGVILNTASTAGLRPRPGLVWYNASKGAVITLTKAMAVELAAEHIRVNALCPVAGETPMLVDFMGGDTPEKRAMFVDSVPMGRLAVPEDIANAALYLASDEGAFITGVDFRIDGGRAI
jgi:3-oxoacyl-[acyl-carrier protein] reductase